MKYVIFNGQLIKTKKANISLLDKGYWFDFCVYSSLKVIQGQPFFLDYHIDRLFESAQILGLAHKFKKEDLKNWTEKLIKKNKITDALLRFVLIGDPDSDESKLYILPITGLTYHKNQDYSHGVKVISYNGQRPIPQAKTKSLLLSFLAYTKAKKVNCQEALMIDDEGNVREGTQTNFYVIKDSQLIVPPSEKCLGGITKKFILEAVKNEFEIIEKDVSIVDVKSGKYEEVFISSTTRNVMPVSQIDDYIVGKSFEKTKKISKLFKDYQDKMLTGCSSVG